MLIHHSTEPTSHLRQSASRLPKTCRYLRITSHILTAQMLSSTNRYPPRRPVLTRFDYSDFPSSRIDVEWDSGHAVGSVNGVNVMFCHQLKRSISCFNIYVRQEEECVVGENLGYGVGARKQRKSCGSYDKPTWTRGEPTYSRLAPFAPSAEFLRFLIRLLRNQVPNMGISRPKGARVTDKEFDADSSLNSAHPAPWDSPWHDLE